MLLGSVDTLLKSVGKVLGKNEQKFHEQLLNKLLEKISSEEFSKYFEEEKKLTFEQTISIINV